MWFGIISLITTSALLYSVKIKLSPRVTAIIPLLIISLQMIASGFVFIYFFAHHQSNTGLNLTLGGISFLLFTALEIYTASTQK